jgi:hypothetical protein
MLGERSNIDQRALAKAENAPRFLGTAAVPHAAPLTTSLLFSRIAAKG